MNELASERAQEIRTILDAAPFPLVISRPEDGTVLYANERIAQMLGLTVQELVGMKSPDLYADPADREALVRQLAQKGRVTDYELRMRDLDGRERWAIFSVALVELGGTKVLITGLTEITERKEAERALSASEHKFRSLVENANDIIYMLTPEGIFSYVSPNWQEILGHDVSEIVGNSFAPLVHPDDLDACYAFLAKVVETGEKQGGIEYRVLHKDGSWRWHTSNASCVQGPDGSVEWFLGIARDITEKKESQRTLERALRELRATQAQLIQAEKMAAVSNMVAAVAHELNSPTGALNSARGTMAQAAGKLEKELGAAMSPQIKRLLDVLHDTGSVIASGALRITEIVQRLESFVRLDQASLKRVDVHEGLESTLALLHSELADRITVEREYGNLPPVLCYAAKLNHVFFNILTNAVQAMKGSGSIHIKTKVDGDAVYIAISDTGPGIERQRLETLFDPGFVRKGDRMGAGLGLPICAQIVEQHGGRIEVDSTLGQGATFTISIPVSGPQPQL